MTISKTNRDATFTTVDGVEAAHVPLADGRIAMLDRASLDALDALGLSRHWTWNDSGQGHAYVRGNGRDNLVMISRMVLNAQPGQRVRYRNDNRLDLRTANLFAEEGGRAKRNATLKIAACL